MFLKLHGISFFLFHFLKGLDKLIRLSFLSFVSLPNVLCNETFHELTSSAETHQLTRCANKDHSLWLPGSFSLERPHGWKICWQDASSQSSTYHHPSDFMFSAKSFPILPLNYCSFLTDMLLRNLCKLNLEKNQDNLNILLPQIEI